MNDESSTITSTPEPAPTTGPTATATPTTTPTARAPVPPPVAPVVATAAPRRKPSPGSVRHRLEEIAQDEDAGTLEVPIRPEEACALLACLYAAEQVGHALTPVKAEWVRDALALLEE